MSQRNIINCYNKNNNNKRKREFYRHGTSTYWLRIPYHLMAIILLRPTAPLTSSSCGYYQHSDYMFITMILFAIYTLQAAGWECILYLILTWPNISYTIHIINQFMAAAQSSYYDVVLRILRDLKGPLFFFCHRIHLFIPVTTNTPSLH